MNFEVIKIYILTFLVITSLLLTLALWKYEPNLEPLYENELVNEVDLGGEERMKRTLIKPSAISFQHHDKYFGLKTPTGNDRLYQDMQEWFLSDYQINEAEGRPNENYQVEVIFPNALPAEMITYLFNVNEDDPLPNWSFERLFMILHEESSSIEVVFLSTEGQQELRYHVSTSDAFKTLWGYFDNLDDLNEQLPFGSSTSPIYVPKNKLEIRSQALAIKGIDERLLIDILLNQSLISANLGGSYFTDGQRRLSILQEGRTMEFINPIHSQDRITDAIQLLDLSITHINEHKGWTNDYRLVDVDLNEEMVRYRMFYEGYPIFNSTDLSVIEQEWRNQNLHLYRRPLFSVGNLPGGRVVELPAGTEVISNLVESENYQLENIQDIQIGYKIANFDDASYSILLEPTWYVKSKGSWSEVRMNGLDEFIRGGS